MRQDILNSNLDEREDKKKKQIINLMSAVNNVNLTRYVISFDLHSTTPLEPATSSENLSHHSPESTRIAAFFLPKKAFSRNENRIGPSYSGGWYKILVFSSACVEKQQQSRNVIPPSMHPNKFSQMHYGWI
jgi:hypothetical protein